MTDHLIIATAADDTVRIYAAVTTQLVAEAAEIHQTWPTATAAFGRVLTATLILGVMSDNLYRLTMAIAGDGPIEKILAATNQRGVVKGYLAQPHVDLDLNSAGKLDVGAAVGKGQLTVIKDFGLKEPYQGIVPLQNGEIGADLAYYLVKSEQTPSAVALGVLVAPDGKVLAAGGLILQLLPGANPEILTALESKLFKLPTITSMLMNGQGPTQIAIELLTGVAELKLLEKVPLHYRCDCSPERFRGPLLSLDQHELEDIIAEQGHVEVRCHFCNKRYSFEKDDLGCATVEDL